MTALDILVILLLGGGALIGFIRGFVHEALSLFAWTGHVWWHLAAAMAVANVAGSLLGTRLALRHGAGFVRGMFIVVVGLLIVKTGYDAFLRPAVATTPAAGPTMQPAP